MLIPINNTIAASVDFGPQQLNFWLTDKFSDNLPDGLSRFVEKGLELKGKN